MEKMILLASSSPRRKEILGKLNYKFKSIPSYINERDFVYDSPIMLSQGLAREKVFASTEWQNNAIVVGADTVVVFEGIVFNKPRDKKEASETLRVLSNNIHQVITSVCVLCVDTGKWIVESETTDVVFRELSNEEIERYVASCEPYDKAGGYAIQGDAGVFVRELKGCYTNVIGFPVTLFINMVNRVLNNEEQ